MTRKRPAFLSKTLFLLLALGFTLCAGVAAQESMTIFLDPPVPVAGVPVTAIVTGTPCTAVVPADGPVLTRNGRELRIELEGVLGCSPPLPELTFIVELGVLEEGDYSLAVLASSEFTEVYGTKNFFVSDGVTIAADPTLDSADELKITLRGLASCGVVLAPTRLEGRRLIVPIDRDCPILPPPPAPFVLELDPIAAPAPGRYQIDVREGNVTVGLRDLEVLPATATVRDGRFEIAVEWRDGSGQQGRARLVQAASIDSALFYFFDPNNWELMVKVFEACAVNGHFWVYSAAATDVEYHVTIRDTLTQRTYPIDNVLGTRAAATADVRAFACP